MIYIPITKLIDHESDGYEKKYFLNGRKIKTQYNTAKILCSINVVIEYQFIKNV